MEQITEPRMLILCSEVIELTDAYQNQQALDLVEIEERYADFGERYAKHREHATKNLRKFNRRTLSN
jgi:hypothetical protein